MSVISDVRLSVRALLAARGFTLTAVATLGLAIGLCAVVFMVVNAYLLRDLPYPGASRLHWIRYDRTGGPSPQDLLRVDWKSADHLLEYQISWDLDVFYMTGGTHAEAVQGAWVTPAFMDGLGVRPAIGPGFDVRAYEPGSPQVALISHRLWQARFAGDPSIVGRRFDAYVSDRPDEAETFTIVGVLPHDFWHVNPFTGVLAPLRAPSYPYMARLRPGVSAADASSGISALIRAGVPTVAADWRANIVSTHGQYVAQMRPILRAASSAAGLVLLIALANVAGLLLVRATKRRREIAVRVALGAGRRAIVRLLLMEAVIIGVLAASTGLLAAGLAIGWLAPIVQRELGAAAPAAMAVDGAALGGAALAGLLAVLVCALAPLAGLWRQGILRSLHSGSRTATEGRGSQRARSVLIALQIAGSLALLTGGTLMMRSVAGLLRVDFGIDSSNVLISSMTLRQRSYPDPASRVVLYDRLLPQLSGVGGVERVALSTGWPLQAPATASVEVESPGGRGRLRAAVVSVTPDYFAALGIDVISGRPFAQTDRRTSEAVAIVSETFARSLSADPRVLGATLTVLPAADGPSAPAIRRRIVGVVRDVRQTPADAELADVYLPLLEAPPRFATVYVRAAGAPTSLIPALRAAVRDVDPEMSLVSPRPLRTLIDTQRSRPAFLAWLLTAFAALAALLALIGVYGVIAYAVRQREREIAVRMAIGASPAAIAALFTRQGARLVLIGLALGVPAAIVTGRLLEHQLFGVAPADPFSLAMATLAFAGAGLLAVWWPARRAAGTDPAGLLRQD